MYKYVKSSVKGKTWQIGAKKRDGKVVGSAIEGVVGSGSLEGLFTYAPFSGDRSVSVETTFARLTERTGEVAMKAVMEKLKENKCIKGE